MPVLINSLVRLSSVDVHTVFAHFAHASRLNDRVSDEEYSMTTAAENFQEILDFRAF